MRSGASPDSSLRLVTCANDDRAPRKISLSKPIGTARGSRRFLVSLGTLEDPLDGLEKSEARAASFPCSKFYCWFYARELVDRDGQLPVGHVSRLFRASSLFLIFFFFFFLFFWFSVLAALTSLPRGFSLRCMPVCLAVRAYYGHDPGSWNVAVRGFFKETTHSASWLVLPLFLPRFADTYWDLNFKPYRKC